MALLYADHNVSARLALLFRLLGHSVVTAREFHQARVGDDAHLLLAAKRGWTLITHPRQDFELLHDAWQRWSKDWQVSPQHAGTLILPQDWADVPKADLLHDFLRVNRPLVNELYVFLREGAEWEQRVTR